jgi:general secretion pathway protein L
MAGTLFIHLSPDAPRWRTDSWGDQPSSDAPLSEAAQAAAGRRVVALVPAADCILAGVDLPTRNRERMARAVPFVLEDRLADDVEELHFALGTRDAQDKIRVAVVARHRMDAWLETLQAVGITPNSLVPEVLALPREPAAWTLLRAPDRVLLRRAEQDGLLFDPDNLATLLPLALTEADPVPARIVVIDCAPEAPPLPPLGAELETRAPKLGDCDPLRLLAAGYRPAEAINLLQGEYSQTDRARRLWRPWRAAAALTLAWLVLQWGWTWLDQRRLAEQELELRTRITRIYLETVPEASKVVDPRLQMQRGIDALRTGKGRGAGGVIDLLSRSLEPLTKTPSLHIASLRYKNRTLTVNLDLSNLQVLDGLKSQLESHGLRVEIRTARSREDKVEGVIAIRGSGTGSGA